MKKRIKKIATFVLALSIVTGANCSTSFAAEPYAVSELVSAPNADVNYNFSDDVTCGTIRYVSQMTYEPCFYPEYWGGWMYQAGSECLTSCISMAHSYIGIDVTPQEILNYGGGVTYHQASWGGSVFSNTDIATAFDNYVNGNGKYSMPIIHLNNYSGAGHYVVLAGQISPTEYQVIDPAISAVWNITINGNVATYSIYGYTVTDYVSSAYQYYNAKAALPLPPAPVVEEEPVEEKELTSYDLLKENLIEMPKSSKNDSRSEVGSSLSTEYNNDNLEKTLTKLK